MGIDACTFPIVAAARLRHDARALAGGELKAIWQSLGAEPGGQPPDEMARFVDTEIRKWAKVVKDSGAKLD